MQQYKETFSNETVSGVTIGNVQKCLRVNDIDEKDHHIIFDMIGLFSFRHWTVKETIDFWKEFLDNIGIKPDIVTVHPERENWRQFYTDVVVLDEGCKWTDGSIGGYCTEFYKNGVEIGNIVNPLDTCIDVGFGLQRLEECLGIKQSYKNHLIYCVETLLSEGYYPSHNNHGFVTKKIIRKMLNRNIEWDHPVYLREKQNRKNSRELYETMIQKDKYKNKSKEWWWQSHGINLDSL